MKYLNIIFFTLTLLYYTPIITDHFDSLITITNPYLTRETRIEKLLDIALARRQGPRVAAGWGSRPAGMPAAAAAAVTAHSRPPRTSSPDRENSLSG